MTTHLRLLGCSLLLHLPLAAQDEPQIAVPRIEASETFPQDGLRGTEPHHWRVIWTEDPQHRALIAWDTGERGSEHTVWFDTEPRQGKKDTYRLSSRAKENGRYSGESPVVHYHYARLEGLEPDTRYWFTLESDEELSKEMYFRTAPAEDQSFSILSGGDSRSDRATRRKVNRFLRNLLAERDDILALAHGGDYVVWGTQWILWDRWLQDLELMTGKDGRVLPILPARGNHEAKGPLFDEAFAKPGGGLGTNYYSTLLSPQVLLLTLNSETAAGGDQANFLKKRFEENRSVRWQLAQYHRPIWPAVKRPSHAAPHWSPLFDDFGLDLAFENDGHVLKRTVAIKNGAADDSGTVYIGEGGMGVGVRTPASDRWYLQAPGVAAGKHHIWEIHFTSKSLELLAWDIDTGKIFDRSTRQPRRRPR